MGNYPLHVLADLKLATVILLTKKSTETRKSEGLTLVPREPIRMFKSERESIDVLHNFIIFRIHCAQMIFLGNILTPKFGGIFVLAQ